MTEEPRHFVRLRFAKLGAVRFTSHRDVARAFERALRRVKAPLSWSEGFSPRPLLSFGLALPTGAESLAEYLDVRLEQPCDPAELVLRLNEALPKGLGVLAGATRDPSASSLQREVTSCGWDLEVDGLTAVELAARIEAVLASPKIPVTRSRKGVEAEFDLRPTIRALSLTRSDGTSRRSVLSTELATQPRGVRPSELIEGLGPAVQLRLARRTQQWIEAGGIRREPLAAPATASGPQATTEHVAERAS